MAKDGPITIAFSTEFFSFALKVFFALVFSVSFNLSLSLSLSLSNILTHTSAHTHAPILCFAHYELQSFTGMQIFFANNSNKKSSNPFI